MKLKAHCFASMTLAVVRRGILSIIFDEVAMRQVVTLLLNNNDNKYLVFNVLNCVSTATTSLS